MQAHEQPQAPAAAAAPALTLSAGNSECGCSLEQSHASAGVVQLSAKDTMMLSPPSSVPSSPGESCIDDIPALDLPAAHSASASPGRKRFSADAESFTTERDTACPAAASALHGALLGCIAQRCLGPLNEPSIAPVCERRAAAIDYDWFMSIDGEGGEVSKTSNPTTHRAALFQQLRALRLVCRAWRDAIGSELVTTLYLNRCSHASKCWWPASAMGHVTRPSEFIKTAPLPADFAARFSGLRRLTLANLRMKHVPEQLAVLQLEQLSLSGNTLAELPQWFGSLPLLELQLGDPWTAGFEESAANQVLCLLGEWLTEANEHALPHTLVHLSLADIKALTRLPKAVRRMTNLESLDLHNTPCSIKDAEYLTTLPLKALVLLNSPSTPPNLPAWFNR